MDSAPWSKRSMSETYNFTASDFSIDDRSSLTNGYGLFRTDTFDLFENVEIYDTDNYISPRNLRLSMSCTLSQSGGNLSQMPNYQVTFYDDENDTETMISCNQSPVINYPLPDSLTIPSTARLWVVNPKSARSLDSLYVSITVTYDIYYRDNGGTGGGGGVPPSWTQNTTAPPVENVTIPTVTTLVGDPAVSARQYLIPPEKILDAFLLVRETTSQLFSLKYMTFLVCFGIILALISWLLH